MVQDSLLSRISDTNFVVYAVWEPILKTDNERAARKATKLFPDERVKDYWVGTSAVGRLFQSSIELTTEPAWDVYLVYAPGIVWDKDTPPKPSFFMHQLSGRLPQDRWLDGLKLREAVEKILRQ